MVSPLEDSCRLATVAQIVGLMIAVWGFLGLFFFGRVARVSWPAWRWCGIVLPFIFVGGMTVWGTIACLIKPSTAPEKFIYVYLYSDAIMLPLMVACSGSVKQSLFSPLFFAIPAMAVVFVPDSAVWLFGWKHIWWVVIVTLFGYLFVYWLPIDDSAQGGFWYRLCECSILAGSVILTVFMSLRVHFLLSGSP